MTREQLEGLKDLFRAMTDPTRYLGDVDAGAAFAEAMPDLLAAAERALVLEDVLATAEAYVAWAHGDGESGHGTALHVAMVAAIDRAKEKP